MAYKEEIIIDVVENGLDEANQKLKALKNNSDEATSGQQNLGSSVLENGGAMGLLNDATGGLAMTIKDAVEATALFVRGSAIATTAQKIYTAVVGASTGGMKLFRLALLSTGIGAIVVGLGLLIANFDKVKKAVLNLVPALAIVGRALDDMVSKSEASLKRSEHFLEANGDKYDQYTQKKIQANIDFNKKVVELNANEELSESEKLKRISDFRSKANRDILKADADRNEETQKKNKEIADKQADLAKQQADKQREINDKNIEAEKTRREAIQSIQKDYSDKLLDLDSTTEQQKRDLEEKRKLAELTNLKATEEQKKTVRDYYDRLEKEATKIATAEKEKINRNRIDAERQAVLDQRQWEIDNGQDGVANLEKQKQLLKDQADFDLEKLQNTIDTSEAESQAKLDAQIAYNQRKQQIDNDLFTNEKAIADKRIVIEKENADKAIALENQKTMARVKAIDDLTFIAGQESKIGRALFLLKQGLAIKELIMEAKKTITFSKLKSAESKVAVATGASKTAAIGFPQNIPMIIGYAAQAVGIISAIRQATGAAGSIASGLGGGSDSGSDAGSAPVIPQAPSFNLVQGTGANQIASAIAGQNAPIQAYVVSGNVTNAQALDRNIIQNSKF